MIFGVATNDLKGWRKSPERIKRATYSLYYDMVRRCYSANFHKKYPTYKECVVCDEWLTFSNFANDLPKIKGYQEWKEQVESMQEIPRTEKMELDKDSLYSGNKLYSLKTCCFLKCRDNIAEANRRNAKNKTGCFSEKVCKARALATDFANFREQQLKFAMSYAKPVIALKGDVEYMFTSLHECAKAIGTSHSNVKRAICKRRLCKGYTVIFGSTGE